MLMQLVFLFVKLVIACAILAGQLAGLAVYLLVRLIGLIWRCLRSDRSSHDRVRIADRGADRTDRY